MGFPRGRYVREGHDGVYHCFSRCVRRVFLYGFDTITGRDFSHRKAWVVGRLRHLAAIFAIEVCTCAVMDNHHDTVLRIRPDIVANPEAWSDTISRSGSRFRLAAGFLSSLREFSDQVGNRSLKGVAAARAAFAATSPRRA